MIESIVQVLQQEFPRVSATPTSKLPPGDLLVTLNRAPVSVLDPNTYRIDWTYSITFTQSNVTTIEETIRRIIKCLERLDIPLLYVSGTPTITLLGKYYLVDVQFVVREELLCCEEE